jgi:hypothetical protein
VIGVLVGLGFGTMAHDEQVVDRRRVGRLDEARDGLSPAACVMAGLLYGSVGLHGFCGFMEPALLPVRLGAKKTPPVRAPEGQILDQ